MLHPTTESRPAAVLRPMTADDAPVVLACMVETFADLDRRLGAEPPPPPTDGSGLVRIRHLAATDPGGSWVAERDGGIIGAALALMREGLWGLSLLVVAPEHQSSGAGTALLRAAVDYGADARGGIILSSDDARAMRAYFRAGFELHPALDARGPVRRPPARPPRVRDGRWPADREIVDAAGRAVRSVGHGDDVRASIASGNRLLVHDDGGFAVYRGGAVKTVAAQRPEVAADLLRAALAAVPDGEGASVEFITSGQDWAVEVALDAGLQLRRGGAIFTRGEVGPMRPYLPSGAYL